MQPWNFQVHIDDLTGLTRLYLEPDSSRRLNRRKHKEIRLGRIQTVGDRLPHFQTGQQRRGFCVIEIQHQRLRRRR